MPIHRRFPLGTSYTGVLLLLPRRTIISSLGSPQIPCPVVAGSEGSGAALMVAVMTRGGDGTCPPSMVTAHFTEPVSGPAPLRSPNCRGCPCPGQFRALWAVIATPLIGFRTILRTCGQTMSDKQAHQASRAFPTGLLSQVPSEEPDAGTETFKLDLFG